jgi:hypothetical protein
MGCGAGSTNPDLQAPGNDLAMSAVVDMAEHPIFNMPGKVYCYDIPACSTSSATPLCCDIKDADAGFAPQCVASAAACAAIAPKAATYACGQAADCPTGQVCCGDINMTGTKSYVNKTVCAASCASPTGTQLCVTGSECKTSGSTCQHVYGSGRDVGICTK